MGPPFTRSPTPTGRSSASPRPFSRRRDLCNHYPRKGGDVERTLALEVVRVTEAAALAAARLMGRGDNVAADQAAVQAMRSAFNAVQFKGRVVIGEGERDEAPMLFIGEEVGSSDTPRVDIAVGPRAKGSIDITATPTENLRSIAKALKVYIEDLCVVILDRPRHQELIRERRSVGGGMKGIGDGDGAGRS